MIRRSVLRAAAEGPFDGATPDGAVREWSKNFAPNAVRRMTRLGLMLGAAMREFPIDPQDAVIYATTFSETVMLARYLESFPQASPLFFQTSIHPSAIEQVLINRACPVRELTPLAGLPGIAAQAALTALLTPGDRVLLTGGEEVGSWMRQLDAASNIGFAFALELGSVTRGENPQPPANAIGELRWTDEKSAASANGKPADADLPALFQAINQREPAHFRCPSGGEVQLTWV